MKTKFGCMVVLALLAFGLMAGCPVVTPPQGPVIVAAQTRTPNPVGAATGSVHVKFVADKSLSNVDQQRVGDGFLRDARKVQVNLTEHDPQNGGPARFYWFELPIVDGVCDGIGTGILPGQYEVRVTLADGQYYSLFASVQVPVVWITPGEETQTPVTVEFLTTYPFRFAVDSLALSGYDCIVKLVERDTYRPFGGSFYNQDGQTVFWFDLPLDFEGGTLVITDLGGTTILYECNAPLDVSELDFGGSYHFGDILSYVYEPTEIYGSLGIEIILGYRDNRYVRLGDRENGQEYNSIAECMAQNPGVILDICLGEGDYEIPYLEYGRRISIIGMGPTQTRLVNSNLNQPSVVRMSPWYEPTDPVQAAAQKSAAQLKGGGGGFVGLYGLEVHNGADKRNAYYSDAAVAVEASVTFVAYNVAVTSESNTCVSANYANQVLINHCDLIGPLFYPVNVIGDPKGIATYDEQDVSVFDSIIGWCGTAIYCTNGAVTLGRNCAYNYGGLTYCERFADWSPDISGFVLADPQFGENWQLLPGSPCRSAASDGNDIGLVFKGK